jgi:hypothetical protein
MRQLRFFAGGDAVMGLTKGLVGVLAAIIAMAAPTGTIALPAEKPVAGKQVHFPNGVWSGLPQVGPNGKVRQCVMVAMRQRAGKDGPVETRFAVDISAGAGLVVTIQDDGLPTEQVLDDQAEIRIDGRSFAAVGFPVGTAFVLHPGDAEGALNALGKASQVTLRSDGAGIDSGAIRINLPTDAWRWLKQCGKAFDIAIDKPTDPDAPEMPVPRSRSPRISIIPDTAAGPPETEDWQKIEGWDASELRDNEGRIIVCFIRRRYAEGSEAGAHRIATQFFVSKLKGLTVVLKDSEFNFPEEQPIEATFKVGATPFTAVSTKVLGRDEIGVFPQHPSELAAAIEKSTSATIRAPTGYQFEFPVQAGVVPWLRACGRRNGFAIEPATP